jgi:hypothetical protein
MFNDRRDDGDENQSMLSQYAKKREKKSEGLVRKYEVSKLSNPNAVIDCIVLEFNDPIARVGIKAWAEEMRRMGYRKVWEEVNDKLIGLDIERAVETIETEFVKFKHKKLPSDMKMRTDVLKCLSNILEILDDVNEGNSL